MWLPAIAKGNCVSIFPPENPAGRWVDAWSMTARNSPCGRVVAVAVRSWHRKAASGEVRLIDVSSKRVIATPLEQARLWAENVAFSHDGTLLAASTAAGDIMLWRVETKDESD